MWTKFVERSSCFSRVVGGAFTVVSWAAIAGPILGFPGNLAEPPGAFPGLVDIRNFWGSDAASILRAFRSGSCGSVSVVSREIRRNGGKCGYQPVWQLMRNTPETPDPGQRPAKFDAASGPQGPGAGGFEAFQDTPPNRRGDSGRRLVMAV